MVKFSGGVSRGKGRGREKGTGGERREREGGLLLREAVICRPWRPLFPLARLKREGREGRQTFEVCSVRTRFVGGVLRGVGEH